MRSSFALFRHSVVPRWVLALAVLLLVVAGGMPMPAPTTAAISSPAGIALALLNPDICRPPIPGQSHPPAPHHYSDCLLCPVCMAHGAILAGMVPPVPRAPASLIGRVQPPLPAARPTTATVETPRARGPPARSA